MNRELFVDSSAWLATLDPCDKYHQVAITFYRDLLTRHVQLLTTNLVIAETYIGVLKAAGHHKAISFLDLLGHSRQIRCVWSDRELETQARDILRRYEDQDFSYTDAVSFALMQQLQLTDAFAFDRHFATAGFVQLPPQQ